ncbi:MAG: SRPBCC family protein [Gammaproteobacteria bacterium]|nr:SRPBCC family protein [Gammaproteobacteria bacterium]
MLRTSLALMTLVATLAGAAEVRDVRVVRDGDQFEIRMQAGIDAAPAAVFQALQDFGAMPQYNHDLRDVRVVPTGRPGQVRLFTVIHTCVLFFCKTMRQEQIMTATANAGGGVLQADLVPQGSDFKQGEGRWEIYPCPDGRPPACLDLHLTLTPSFWVPPLLGPWIIRIKMEDEARRTSDGLERLARAATGGR